MGNSQNFKANILNKYMFDIGNLRSHHWKYWLDLYENCAYDCKYCIYRVGEKMGKIKPIVTDINDFKQKIKKEYKGGIVYLGPKADIYQALEKKNEITPKVLEVFLELDIPIFIVTRSELIIRDIGLLKKLATKGLVEISISIASTQNLKTLEPNTPTLDKRLDIIKELTRHGIPVSVHFSPIIPNLDSLKDIENLFHKLKQLDITCIYACFLGMMDEYYNVILNNLPTNYDKDILQKLYQGGNSRNRVYSLNQEYILNYMKNLSDFCSKNNIPFACVHIPEFDTVERNGNIFEEKLPNIGDITRTFNNLNKNLHFTDLTSYLLSFKAVDDDFLVAIEKFWKDKILFKNTYFHPEFYNGELVYVKKDFLDLEITNMRIEHKV